MLVWRYVRVPLLGQKIGRSRRSALSRRLVGEPERPVDRERFWRPVELLVPHQPHAGHACPCATSSPIRQTAGSGDGEGEPSIVGALAKCHLSLSLAQQGPHSDGHASRVRGIGPGRSRSRIDPSIPLKPAEWQQTLDPACVRHRWDRRLGLARQIFGLSTHRRHGRRGVAKAARIALVCNHVRCRRLAPSEVEAGRCSRLRPSLFGESWSMTNT
jgi:hypothetical protein